MSGPAAPATPPPDLRGAGQDDASRLLVRGVQLPDRDGLVDLRIADGKFTGIGRGLAPAGQSLPESASEPPEGVIDAGGRLALPPFIESHVHLDSALTAGEPEYNLSGTLFEGIHRWSQRKDLLTVPDVKDRVHRVVRYQAGFGVQFVRTHVDVTDPKLTALHALLELREELSEWVTIQIVAFPQEGVCSFPRGKELLQEAADLGVDALGAIPHYEFTREYAVESLDFVCRLAAERGLLVDVHCDEIDDEASRGLETLATRAYELGLGPRVTASHTTAMHSYNNAYFLRLLRLLRLSGINFVSNPLVSAHLQGRTDTYPKRRGVTRVKELLDAGVNVSFGQDDIQDPWNPLGTGNLRDVVFNGLYITQLLAHEEIALSHELVTTNAARTLNLHDYGIEVGRPASFVLLDATNWMDALNWAAPVIASYREGRLISRTEPARCEVLF